MNPVLPAGIVSNSRRITHELGSSDAVDVEDVAMLWRVYTSSKTTLGAYEDRRLENLFWRIWISGRINRSIRGSTLAALFANITEGDSVIRTGPRGSGESAEDIHTSSYRQSSRAPQRPGDYLKSPRKVRSDESSSRSLTPKPPAHQPLGRTPLPPPILKNPPQSQSPDATPRAGRTGLLLSGSSSSAGGDVHHAALSASPSPIAGTYGSQLTDSSNGMQRPRRKKTSFAADVTSVEGETVLREKMEPLEKETVSPDSHTAHASFNPPPRLIPALEDAIKRQIYPVALGPKDPLSPLSSPPTSNPTPTPKPPIAHGPMPTNTQPQPAYNAAGIPTSPIDEPQSPQPAAEPLVDKDFRTKFAEKRMQESRMSSSTSLSGSARFLGHGFRISPPPEQHQQRRTSEQEYPSGPFPDMPETPPQASSHTSNISGHSSEHPSAMNVPEDPFSSSASPESSSVRSSLPQRQSQLSKLIERDRRMSAEMPPKK